ncbi:hypothetical protein NS226_11950 [Aureimonas ureilytica]|uniref:Uncharacterized protein n=1 Tax=Aureimonas ureilytica TaxID=401562 RepID=A0A175R7X6_9HYPH|nr:hypothetical protein [Aureimonas ureilytica]KTQ95267.1 hypothetical protein NS226_11950 [Aureimonas ureilytica]
MASDEDPIITVLRLSEETDDPDELTQLFRETHPDLPHQAFLDACMVALDIIGSRPPRLH